MPRAAKARIEKSEEPSPKSLMARLAALQEEFAAKIQQQEGKLPDTSPGETSRAG